MTLIDPGQPLSQIAAMPNRTMHWLAFWAPSAFLAGCSSGPTIAAGDVSMVLKAAVELAGKSGKVPTDACFSIRFEAPLAPLPGKPGEWTRTENGKASYRLLPIPKVDGLPTAALAAIPQTKRAATCHHQLVFNPPEFVEMDEGGRKSIIAFVSFTDHCPICGAGYQVMLTRTGQQWKPDPSGITTTRVS